MLELETFKNNYIAPTADSIKYMGGFQNEYLNEHKKDFIIAWMETFPRNISTYFTAHALATYEFWALSPWQTYMMRDIWKDAPINVYVNQTVFIHAITHEALYGEDVPSWALNQYVVPSDRNVFPHTINQSIGVFMSNNIFYVNGGVCGFILLVFMAITLETGQRRKIIAVLPILFAWGTVLLAAPIAFAFRYVFYFALLMPFILTLPFMEDRE